MSPLPPIALYCSSSSYGGLEMNTADLAFWLTELGHKTTLCAEAQSPLEKQASNDGVPILPIIKNRRYGDILLAERFSRELKKRNIGIIIFVDNRDLDFAMWVRLFSGSQIKVVYQQHMMLGVKRKDLLHTLRYRSLDAWITLLPYMAKEIISKTNYPENRIEIIPLGVNIQQLLAKRIPQTVARAKLGLPEKGKVMGILGRLDPQKGQHLAIEALARLRANGHDKLHLLIMGEATHGEHADYKQDLQRLILKYNLTEYTHIAGYQKDIGPFFSAIDLFVLGSYGETYGMVTIESMLFGVPVVGSDAGGTPEILNHGAYGWLYPARDVGGMVNAIDNLLSDIREAEKRTVRAKEYAQTAFSHIKECKQLEILLTKLVKDKDEKQTV